MNHMIRLELAKQRLVFWGVAFSFAVSLPMAAAGGGVVGIPFSHAVRALMLFWLTIGLPVAALLMGAAAGAGLRAEPAAGAESLLPLSPRQRGKAAFSAAFIHLAVSAALIVAASVLAGPLDGELGFIFSRNAPAGLRVLAADGALALIYLCLAGFSASYLARHGLAGGLIGAVIGGATVLCLGLSLMLGMLLPDCIAVPFAGRSFLILALALAAASWAMGTLMERLERKAGVGVRRGFLAAGALAVGVFLAAGAVKNSADLALRRPIVLDDDYLSWYQKDVRGFLPAVRRAESRGTLAANLEGGFYLIRPDGSRTTLMAPEPARLKDILDRPFWSQVISWAWDDDGSLWVLSEPRGRQAGARDAYELHHGAPDAALPLHSVLPDLPRPAALTRIGRSLCLLAYQGDEYLAAPLPGKGRPPSWTKIGADWRKGRDAARVKDGLAVYAGPDGTIRKERGTKSVMAVVPATVVAGKSLFLVPAKRKEGFVLNVYEGMRLVRSVWSSPEATRYFMEPTADGAWWGWRDKSSLHLLTKEGDFLRPVSLAAAYKGLPIRGREPERLPHVLRVEAGRVWLLLHQNRFLAEVDASSGALLRFRRLPQPLLSEHFRWHAVPEGFFLDTGRALHFIKWDGESRRLGWKS